MGTQLARPRWILFLLALLLTTAALSACNRGEGPDVEIVQTAPAETQAPAATATPLPAATNTPPPEPTNTPPPAPTPARGQMSLDDYAAWCAEFASAETTEEEGVITYGEFSETLALMIGLLEPMNPPQEVAAWHQALLSSQRDLKTKVDDYSGAKSDPIDIELFFSLLMSYHQSLAETMRALDPEILDWLITAGCIDEEMAAAAESAGLWDDAPALPETTDDVERTALTIGVAMEGPLTAADPTDYFVFDAEEGKEYLVETVWTGYERMHVMFSDSSSFWKSRDRGRPPIEITWTAPRTGQYHVNISPSEDPDSTTSSYTLTVHDSDQTVVRAATATPMPAAAPTATTEPTLTLEPAETTPPAPDGVHYAFEGTTIRISWQPVEGADHYNIYHDDFFDSSCSLDEDGNPSFCEALALNVTDTTYLHTEPDPAKNYYWVVACNQETCSQVDSTNPAGPIADRPNSPSTVTYTREGNAIRISWNAVEGADYYNVYYDSFFDSGCTVPGGGDISFCDELAVNLVDTTYVHAEPDDDQNFYWVAACNRGGCSEIASEEPAGEE